MKYVKLPAIGLFFALLAGCALFNFASPNTWNERLAYAYSLETGAANAITAQAESGQLTRNEANDLVDIVANAKSLTDGARDAMRGGDTTTAEGKLRLARSILIEINDYLGTNR